jgi:ribonuclease E
VEDGGSEEKEEAPETIEEPVEPSEAQANDRPEEAGGERRRGRRRRRRGRERDRERHTEPPAPSGAIAAIETDQELEVSSAGEAVLAEAAKAPPANAEGGESVRRRRRRGRRGGRRRRRGGPAIPGDEMNVQDRESASEGNGSEQLAAGRAERDGPAPSQHAPQILPSPAPEHLPLDIRQRGTDDASPESTIEAHTREPSSEPGEAASHAAASQEPRKRGWWRRF